MGGDPPGWGGHDRRTAARLRPTHGMPRASARAAHGRRPRLERRRDPRGAARRRVRAARDDVRRQRGPDGPVLENALEGQAWFGPVSWVVQIMPLFFIAGGFSSFHHWRSMRARGASGADYVRARLERLVRPGDRARRRGRRRRTRRPLARRAPARARRDGGVPHRPAAVVPRRLPRDLGARAAHGARARTSPAADAARPARGRRRGRRAAPRDRARGRSAS